MEAKKKEIVEELREQGVLLSPKTTKAYLHGKGITLDKKTRHFVYQERRKALGQRKAAEKDLLGSVLRKGFRQGDFKSWQDLEPLELTARLTAEEKKKYQSRLR
jgi:hypothetical protein